MTNLELIGIIIILLLVDFNIFDGAFTKLILAFGAVVTVSTVIVNVI